MHQDEIYAEFKAQLERCIELVDHKPNYFHNHAYVTKTTDEVTHTLAKEYNVICTVVFIDNPEVKKLAWASMYGGGPEAQLTEDTISYITNDKGNIPNKE